MLDRRELFRLTIGALALRCASTDPTRLRARPSNPTSIAPAGLYELQLGRPTLLYVPEKPSGAFMLMLHGATQTPQRMLVRLKDAADALGVTIVAPKSAGITRDAIAVSSVRMSRSSTVRCAPHSRKAMSIENGSRSPASPTAQRTPWPSAARTAISSRTSSRSRRDS